MKRSRNERASVEQPSANVSENGTLACSDNVMTVTYNFPAHTMKVVVLAVLPKVAEHDVTFSTGLCMTVCDYATPSVSSLQCVWLHCVRVLEVLKSAAR